MPTKHRMLKVGLTGGIACGKSTVAEIWSGLGGSVVDTDRLAHQALRRGTPSGEEVVRVFGREILGATGEVDRSRLGEIVFGDEQERFVLNGIVHPVVRQAWLRELTRLKDAGSAPVAVVSIPLLYEVGAEKEFDVVVAVGCSEKTQFSRLSAKGLTEAQARARIAAQWPVQSKLDRADYVIWNDGSRTVLREQSETVWHRMKENCNAPTQN